MKHLLLILSILLFSSPLFGQSTTEKWEKAIEMFNKMGNEDFLEDGDDQTTKMSYLENDQSGKNGKSHKQMKLRCPRK